MIIHEISRKVYDRAIDTGSYSPAPLAHIARSWGLSGLWFYCDTQADADLVDNAFVLCSAQSGGES